MTTKQLRPIVVIDESKCNGCGQCITACAEGALRIIDGKAKLVSEVYCDGLGACLGECPQGAISIEQREAQPFDEKAVAAHLAQAQSSAAVGHACPGSQASMVRHVATGMRPAASGVQLSQAESALVNWPVQLSLLPLGAPYLNGANLLISADCVPFALPDFHSRFLQGRVVTIGCPKLDDVQMYCNKLAEIFRRNDIASIHVVFMEVPCCGGLVRAVQIALAQSGKSIPLTLSRIGIDGQVQETMQVA